MERYVLLVFTLLCIYVTFSYAEETTEMKISFQHVESQPNDIDCPGRLRCPDTTRCCKILGFIDYCCSKASQQVETELKRNGFIGISGNVFSPDETQQCPDGTRTCKLPSGIDDCCLIQNPRWIKIMDTIPHKPIFVRGRRP